MSKSVTTSQFGTLPTVVFVNDGKPGAIVFSTVEEAEKRRAKIQQTIDNAKAGKGPKTWVTSVAVIDASVY